jgi:hypothetical protein
MAIRPSCGHETARVIVLIFRIVKRNFRLPDLTTQINLRLLRKFDFARNGFCVRFSPAGVSLIAGTVTDTNYNGSGNTGNRTNFPIRHTAIAVELRPTCTDQSKIAGKIYTIFTCIPIKVRHSIGTLDCRIRLCVLRCESDIAFALAIWSDGLGRWGSVRRGYDKCLCLEASVMSDTATYFVLVEVVIPALNVASPVIFSWSHAGR